MNNDTKKPRNTAAESYRNRMSAYAKGMKALTEKSRASAGDTRKDGAKS